MRPWQAIFGDYPWLGAALFQVTAAALLGWACWLLARRGSPAARSAVLLAALIGVLIVPFLGGLMPVWLPVPEPPLPPVALGAPLPVVIDWGNAPAAAEAPTFEEARATEPAPAARIEEPAASVEVPTVFEPAVSAAPPRTVAQLLILLWLAGVTVGSLRSLLGLIVLYRLCARAVPLTEPSWLASLQPRGVQLRVSSAIGSPLTLGLFRSIILLPSSCHAWSVDQRAMILAHELAHIRRRDYLAGLLAELAVCVHWFHPLVRWLATRLRLEQEYAADAAAMTDQPDAHAYLSCLARLALELDRGVGSLAPAFLRRRPEIFRRITMLRCHPRGQASLLGRRAASAVGLGAFAACLMVAGTGYLHSANPAVPDAKKDDAKVRMDLHGDALPSGAAARLGTLRFRYGASAIAYSPDGKLLAAGGNDNKIRLLDAVTGQEIRRLAGHAPRSFKPADDPKNPFGALVAHTGEGGVNTVAFSPDGKTLASGGWDDCVRLWDVETGKEIRKIDAHKAMVGSVVFSRDGKVLASRGALDGSAKLWDPTTGTLLHKFVGLTNINPWRFKEYDSALAISPDNKTVVVTARKAIVAYDLATGAEKKRIDAHNVGISVAYSPDGKLLASCGVDEGKDEYSIRVWDADGKELRRCEMFKKEPPIYVTFDPTNSGKLAAVFHEDVVHIYDSATGKEVCPVKQYWPSRVAFAKDGKTLISAGLHPIIRTWDAATGKELGLDVDAPRNGVAAVALTADGKLAATAGRDGVRLWEPATGKQVRAIEVKGGATALAFLTDGKTLAVGGNDKLVHLIEIETGKSTGELKGHKHAINSLAASPDGKLLASGDAQATVYVWDLAAGKDIQIIDNKAGAESLSLAFSPDSKSLACGGAWNDSSFLPKKGTKININGKEIEFDGEIDIQGITMSRKEGYFVLVWDANTGKELHKLAGLKDKVKSVAYSPDGKLLAGSSKDGKVCLWDATSGEERLHLLAHPNHAEASQSAVPCVAFAPDSKTLATAGTDHTIRLWDVATAKERGGRHAGDSAITSLVFGKDGKTLVTGSGDATALVWDLSLPYTPPPDGKSNVIMLR